MLVAFRRLRYWGPLALALVCLISATMLSPVVAWLLIIFAFGLVLEAGTAWFEKAGGTGGLHDHRQ